MGLIFWFDIRQVWSCYGHLGILSLGKRSLPRPRGTMKDQEGQCTRRWYGAYQCAGSFERFFWSTRRSRLDTVTVRPHHGRRTAAARSWFCLADTGHGLHQHLLYDLWRSCGLGYILHIWVLGPFRERSRGATADDVHPA